MRPIHLALLIIVAVQSVPSLSQGTSEGLGCELRLAQKPGQPATRDQVFKGAKEVRDCLRKRVGTERQPANPRGFWLGLLGLVGLVGSGALVALSFMKFDEIARRDLLIRSAAVVVAFSVALAATLRLFVWSGDPASEVSVARDVTDADWRWQMDMARAAQLANESDAIEEALDATEHLVEHQPQPSQR
jgi:hypothetical protein